MSQTAPALLAAARAKLGEIADETSLPDDAVTLFGALVGLAEAQAVRLAALEAAADAPAAVAGVNVAALLNAQSRIAESRANGALSGTVAAIVEDVIAALLPPLTLDQTAAAGEADGGSAAAPAEPPTEPPAEPPIADEGATQPQDTAAGEADGGAPGGS
ncbi:MAG: hypothetical protein BroJett013_30270 [Alphaproteobacteria bacterium]|nr:MAG: hypothetical protein BroJett013_30270 [Alphaproteobacteria bacterium]